MRSLDRSEADWRLLLLHLTLGDFVVLLIGARPAPPITSSAICIRSFC